MALCRSCPRLKSPITNYGRMTGRREPISHSFPLCQDSAGSLIQNQLIKRSESGRFGKINGSVDRCIPRPTNHRFSVGNPSNGISICSISSQPEGYDGHFDVPCDVRIHHPRLRVEDGDLSNHPDHLRSDRSIARLDVVFTKRTRRWL